MVHGWEHGEFGFVRMTALLGCFIGVLADEMPIELFACVVVLASRMNDCLMNEILVIRDRTVVTTLPIALDMSRSFPPQPSVVEICRNFRSFEKARQRVFLRHHI